MKGLKSYLIGSVLLVVTYLVVQFYKPKPIDWTPTYVKEHKIPFGTYILHKEIGSLFPNSVVRVSRQRTYNTLKGKSYRASNYLIIAGAVKLDRNDYTQLARYMRSGNDVFIAASDFGGSLNRALRLKTAVSFSINSNRVSSLDFTNPSLKAPSPYTFKGDLANQYFSKFDTARVTVLGRDIQGNANFIRYSFDKGNLYLIPNPRLFTNYSLISNNGAAYASKALSYLNKTDLLLWDESNVKLSTDDRSILRVLLRHPELKWAYYLSLTGLLIFVFFEMKRRQRIIPIRDALANTSLEFVKLVGKIYYQKRDNRDIAEKKIAYFLSFVRSNFRLKTNDLNKSFAEDLSNKSGVQHEYVNELLEIIRQLDGESKVSDKDLIRLNKSIEQFYKKSI